MLFTERQNPIPKGAPMAFSNIELRRIRSLTPNSKGSGAGTFVQTTGCSPARDRKDYGISLRFAGAALTQRATAVLFPRSRKPLIGAHGR